MQRKARSRIMEIGGIGYIILAVLVGWFWTTKGRSFWFGLLWSIVLTPLISFIIGLFLKRK